jgi:HTH-type transcriptional regulator/antitoxin HigA
MIRNDQEYKVTKSALISYEEALADFDILKSIEQGVAPVIAEAQRTSYQRQAAELREQIEAYDALKGGEATEFSMSSFASIGKELISARIAKGLTQRELASLAGLKEQQIQRYEKDAYETANLRRLEYIARVLDVNFVGKITVKPASDAFASDFLNALDPGQFPISDMNSKGWFDSKLDLRRASVSEKKRALAVFFTNSGVIQPSKALHKKTAGPGSRVRQAALLSWQARILLKARRKTGLARRYTPLSPDMITSLVSMSRLPDGPVLAVDMLLSHGIIVVFEKHLEKTRLDGAAMSLDGRYAVIGMTLRHDRIDNFWYVLLHELGHVTRHWGPLLTDGFLDEEGDDLSETLESEADEFATNAIVPNEAWAASFVRFTKSPEAIIEFAKKRNIHEALVAGRIRKERGNYAEFSDLIGSGRIRSLIKNTGLME